MTSASSVLKVHTLSTRNPSTAINVCLIPTVREVPLLKSSRVSGGGILSLNPFLAAPQLKLACKISALTFYSGGYESKCV